uniref:Malic enzyme n=1 Tax=Heligmosomoides polygyrus TaxID=6339 RepID=A0A8L8PZT0_HELPZ
LLRGNNFRPDSSDPKAVALYKLYRPERITPPIKGYALIKNPRYNKGMAFSLFERHYLGIHGLIPPAFMTEEQQVYRVMKRIREQPDNLAKYVQLDELQNRTEKLFYRVICENVKELLPIVYTPTVGLACQKFGAIYRAPKGVYITINDNSISKIHQILSNWKESDVRCIVVTDGERILGLGDLGAYGMGIPVGKLALYVALAGIRPEHCLPVVIDVGTNNQKHLEDPLYIGLRRKRVRGEKYDQLVDNFMKAVTKRFGRDTLIQFEDFAFENAFKFLDRYREDYCVFNDDIQGTAAVIVAGLLATTRITKKRLCEQKFLFHGAGAAGLGIAELMVMQMMDEGASQEDACAKIHMIDINGLVTKKRAESMTERHRLFAKDMPESKNLLEIVKAIQPNAIIGVSTQGGAFTEEIIKEMAKINERPIIFALSNPTHKAECTAEAAIKGTDGRVLYAAGSPFENVEYNGKLFKPGQGNNSYVFPGVGLAAVIWKAKKVPERAFLVAAREMYVRAQLYDTHYDQLINKDYQWPPEDSKAGYTVPEYERISMGDE